MERKNKYRLVGFFIVSLWIGGTGFKNLVIYTDDKGLSEIEKDPLQDYIEFGVESVDYAQFDIYKEVITEDRDKTITIEYNTPIKRIEEGEYNLTDKEEEMLFKDIPVTIFYNGGDRICIQ